MLNVLEENGIAFFLANVVNFVLVAAQVLLVVHKTKHHFGQSVLAQFMREFFPRKT